MTDTEDGFRAFERILEEAAESARSSPEDSDGTEDSYGRDETPFPSRDPRQLTARYKAEWVAAQEVLRSLEPPIACDVDSDDGSLVIRSSRTDLLRVHLQLANRWAEAPSYTDLKSGLSRVLEYIHLRLGAAIRAREEAAISFKMLVELIQPGSVVYYRHRTLLGNATYEVCARVLSTSLEDSDAGGQVLAVTVTNSGTYFPEVYKIREFRGHVPLTADNITLIPFHAFPDDEQAAIISRLTRRLETYREINKGKDTLWAYDGPISVERRAGFTRALLKRPDDFGNWHMNGRILVCRLADQGNKVSKILQTESPSTDHEYLLLAPVFLAHLPIDDLLAFGVVDFLKPVQWLSDPLAALTYTAKKEIADLVETFSASVRLAESAGSTQGRLPYETLPRAGLTFNLRGKLPACRNFVQAIAEHARRPLIRLDVLTLLTQSQGRSSELEDAPSSSLDHSTGEKMSPPRPSWCCLQDGYSSPQNFELLLTRKLYRFSHANPVYLVEQCGEMMERRSFRRSRESKYVEAFFDVLRFFPGIVFLWPDVVEDMDPLFEDLDMNVIDVGDTSH